MDIHDLKEKLEGHEPYIEVVQIATVNGLTANLEVSFLPTGEIELARNDFPPEEEITLEMKANRSRNLMAVIKRLEIVGYPAEITYLGVFGTFIFGP